MATGATYGWRSERGAWSGYFIKSIFIIAAGPPIAKYNYARVLEYGDLLRFLKRLASDEDTLTLALGTRGVVQRAMAVPLSWHHHSRPGGRLGVGLRTACSISR